MILSKFLFGPSKETLSIASKFMFLSLFLTCILIKFWTLNTLSQVTIDTHYTLAKLARISKFGYSVCKEWFHVIMSHKSLQVLSPHSVVAKQKPKHQSQTFELEAKQKSKHRAWSTEAKLQKPKHVAKPLSFKPNRSQSTEARAPSFKSNRSQSTEARAPSFNPNRSQKT